MRTPPSSKKDEKISPIWRQPWFPIAAIFLSLLFLLVIAAVVVIKRNNNTGNLQNQTPVFPAAQTEVPDPFSPDAPAAILTPVPEAGQQWFTEAIDLNQKVGVFSSLEIGLDGTLYAAYLDDLNDELKVAVKKNALWEYRSISESLEGSIGWYPALALDPQGGLYLACYSVSSRQILYGSMSADGAWSFEAALENVSAIDVSLTLDAQANPHIVFFDDEIGQLRYLTRDENGWVASTISEANINGAEYPLAVDKNNQVHTVFLGAQGGLFHAVLQGGAWTATPVDENPSAGAYPSLAVDGSGVLHVSYSDSASQDLLYAAWDGTNWQRHIVDSEGSVGQYSSIAIDQHGLVHISYYDEGNAALKYAQGQGSSWTTRIVDDGQVGKYTSLVIDANNNPGISYYDEGSRVLLYAYGDVYGVNAVTNHMTAFHRSGQTFLTWMERFDFQNERYRIYRSNQPIHQGNLANAVVIAEVGESSSRLWANYHEGDGIWGPRITEYTIIQDHAPALGKGVGSFIWTSAQEDFGGNSGGTVYYAVTVLDGSSEQFSAEYASGPVEETVADPVPVEITNSPGIRVRPGPGGHYYLQYMDFRNWNPTFHAPNTTNLYYGFDPAQPEVQHALAYAYDYAIYEPAPELCGGSVPDTLPVMIFLHGARGNRYGAPEQYPYPYCAYGVYPIDESETWYFGFARNHDYRSNAPFSPDDVVENYTERRVLRMIYDLIRNPPGPSVDPQRIYLFGHSMGGTGSLAFAQRYPNVFAAIYSGQPVTRFYATEGYDEPWPANLATKWGPQELNLPVSITAPNSWADRLQKYNGSGVFTWQNLREAFDPNDPLNRLRDDMVPFAVDHGTIDDAVLFASQGAPLYPLLNASPVTWAGAITEAEHQWSDFGWSLPNLARSQGVPFWNFSVIRDETVPGLSNVSGNNPQLPTAPTSYNQTILWSASWNAWDGAPVDTENEWQMSFCSVEEGSQTCGGSVNLVVDITPRRLQNFVVTSGAAYQWQVIDVGDGQVLAEGTVTPDEDGLLTIRQVNIPPSGIRLRIFR